MEGLNGEKKEGLNGEKKEGLNGEQIAIVEIRLHNTKHSYFVREVKRLYNPLEQNLANIIKETIRNAPHTDMSIIGHFNSPQKTRISFYLYANQPIDDNIKLICELEGSGLVDIPPTEKHINCKSFLIKGVLAYIDISLSSFCDVVAEIFKLPAQ